MDRIIAEIVVIFGFVKCCYTIWFRQKKGSSQEVSNETYVVSYEMFNRFITKGGFWKNHDSRTI
jgi:hypothetical protein